MRRKTSAHTDVHRLFGQNFSGGLLCYKVAKVDGGQKLSDLLLRPHPPPTFPAQKCLRPEVDVKKSVILYCGTYQSNELSLFCGIGSLLRHRKQKKNGEKFEETLWKCSLNLFRRFLPPVRIILSCKGSKTKIVVGRFIHFKQA